MVFLGLNGSKMTDYNCRFYEKIGCVLFVYFKIWKSLKKGVILQKI